MASSIPPTAPPGLPPRILRQAAAMMRAISHPARLRIIELLLKQQLPVGELALAMRMSPHLVSGHLKELRVVNAVSFQRDGRQKLYRVASPEAAMIFRCIQRNYFTNLTFQNGEAI